MIRNIFAPLTEETTESLSVRDIVLMSGSILVARDAAHKRMYDTLKAGKNCHFLYMVKLFSTPDLHQHPLGLL